MLLGSRSPSVPYAAARVGQRCSKHTIGHVMKGKGKSRARDRDLWGFGDSDDDDLYGSSAPAAFSMMEELAVSPRPHAPIKEIRPRNEAQERYVKLLETPAPPIIVAVGPAGVAKTFLCSAVGIQKLLAGSVDKLIITRPAVSVAEQLGHLPGTLEEKMDPWMRPIYDVFYKFVTPAKVQALIQKQQIEICPLGFMRGRTFDNAWIVADEMQNSTPEQMLMMLTRIGRNSKLVITGDPAQHDRGFERNGLTDLMRRLDVESEAEHHDIRVCRFTEEHVERHPVIKKVLRLYGARDAPSF
jgi:phosphate starvation-inducible protein PhoH and related proteins